MIHSFWLLLLGLGSCGKTKLCTKVSFYQHRARVGGKGAGEWLWECQIHLHLPPPVCCLLGSVIETVLAVFEFHEVGSQ